MKKYIALFIAFMMLALNSQVLAQEVSYDLTDVTAEAQIRSDGSLEFQERYSLDVDFMNGVYMLVDYGEGTVTDYKVGVVDQNNGQINYLTESMNGLPGTFRTTDDGQIMRFQVFHPAENESVDFIFEYKIANLITNYLDTAELNRKLIGENISESFNYSARIYLPGLVDNTNDFRAWAYGPGNGQVSLGATETQSFIDIEVVNNPANQFIEVHSIFPTSLTPNNQNLLEKNVKDQIIDEANAQVEADREAYQQQMLIRGLGALALVIFGPLMTLIAGIYYFRHRRKLNPQPANIPEHIYSLPEDITPAIMATSVLRKKPTADDFSATIIDMARKGYLKIEEVEREKRGLFSRKSASTVKISPALEAIDLTDLQKHERYVYEYLMPDNQPVLLSDIEEAINKSSTFKKQQYRKWTQFSNYVEVVGEKHRNSPKQNGRAQALAVLAVIIAALILAPAILLILDSQFMDFLPYLIGALIINLIIAFIIMVFTIAKPIRTYEEDRRQKEWKAFANMLENIGNFRMRDIASLPLWEEYLAYAVSLDVADKVIEAMNDQYGADEIAETMHMPMTFYRNPYWINSVMRQSITSSIASVAPKQSYSGSNRGGFGGGFSSGSSGGSGGGGGFGGF